MLVFCGTSEITTFIKTLYESSRDFGCHQNQLHIARVTIEHLDKNSRAKVTKLRERKHKRKRKITVVATTKFSEGSCVGVPVRLSKAAFKTCFVVTDFLLLLLRIIWVTSYDLEAHKENSGRGSRR